MSKAKFAVIIVLCFVMLAIVAIADVISLGFQASVCRFPDQVKLESALETLVMQAIFGVPFLALLFGLRYGFRERLTAIGSSTGGAGWVIGLGVLIYILVTLGQIAFVTNCNASAGFGSAINGFEKALRVVIPVLSGGLVILILTLFLRGLLPGGDDQN